MPRPVSLGALVILVLLAAAAPILGMRFVLQAHVISTSETTLGDLSARVLAHTDAVLAEAADALAGAAPLARAECSPEARSQLTAATDEATWLRALVVLGPGGRATCGSSELVDRAGEGLRFRPTSVRQLEIANSAGAVGRATLVLRWTEGQRSLVAFVATDAHRLDVLPSEWRIGGAIQWAFADAEVFSTIANAGDVTPASSADGRVLTARAVSQRFPVEVVVSVPVTVAWAGASWLAMLVQGFGGLLALLFAALVLQALRKPRSVEDAIERGLAHDEFVPYYQPVFDIQNGKLVGAEVLVRWVKKDGTVVPPGLFIQKAEESGLAVEMTRRVMRKSRDELGKAYALRPGLKIAINLFADHFSDLSTVEDVRDIFQRGGVAYSQLVFEVTERYPLSNLNRARVAIAGLQSLGCRVALDDAGTGHGGLAYLQKLGMDQIKIDKLFVDTISQTSASSPIVDSLVDLGRSLGMEIVAEGVETAEQLRYLKGRGVHCAQGFLFAKPLPGPLYLQMVEALDPVAVPEPAPTPRAAKSTRKRAA